MHSHAWHVSFDLCHLHDLHSWCFETKEDPHCQLLDQSSLPNRIKVTRDSALDPWEIVGNQIHFDEACILHFETNINSGGVDTKEESVEFEVQEADAVNLTSVDVAGTGITDGTLTEGMTPFGDDEWYADLTASGGDPAPFDGDITLIEDGGDYTYTIDTEAMDTAAALDSARMEEDATATSLTRPAVSPEPGALA